MSREVTIDHNDFLTHLRDRNGNFLFGDSDFDLMVKQVHKRFLALLLLCSELTEPDGDCQVYFNARFGAVGADYLKEVVSDIGQSSYCLIMGLHKPALITIRSSIESLCKALSYVDDNSVLTKKAVHEVFDLAKKSIFFSETAQANELSRLLTIYDRLNLYVHTVTPQNMFHLMSLGIYPSFDKNKNSLTSKIILNVINSMVFLITHGIGKEFFKLHFRNRDVIFSGLTASQRQKINNSF